MKCGVGPSLPVNGARRRIGNLDRRQGCRRMNARFGAALCFDAGPRIDGLSETGSSLTSTPTSRRPLRYVLSDMLA